MLKTIKIKGFGLTLAAVAAMGLSWGVSGEGWSKDKHKDQEKKSAIHSASWLAYVVLAEKGHALKGETIPVARLVLEHAQGFSDASCANMTMSNGQGASIQLVTRPNPNPADMPITICEAAIPFADQHHVKGDTWTVVDQTLKTHYAVQLPTVSQAPESALILGDTGCRDTKAQTCVTDWPFPSAMAEEMADQLKKSKKPAVIIHVGDYKYRGKADPKPNGDTNNTGLKWSNWKADFFTPMQGGDNGPNLFAMAPWVVARGNHEMCKEMGDNGDGWFYLLDPTSPVAGDSPQQVQENSCKGVADGMTRPYRLDFANGLSLVVTDTAGLYEAKDLCTAQAAQLTAWYQEMATNFQGSKQLAWLITHKPIWAVLGSCGKGAFGNPTPQAALEPLKNHALPESIKLTLMGHKHLYSSLDVNPKDAKRRMLELVAGNGGVVLNTKDYSGCLQYDATATRRAFYADVWSMSHFGYVAAQLDVDKKEKTLTGWQLNTMALENTTGPDWGKLEKVAVCQFPVKLGEPACNVKKKKFFAKACKQCDSVNGPDKLAKSCPSGSGDAD